MAVSKKDFTQLAAIIREAKRSVDIGDFATQGELVLWIQDALTNYFDCENDRFDAPQFIKACELKEDK